MEVMSMGVGVINLRLTLDEEDPVREKFERIKAHCGLVSNTEVMRMLIRRFHLKVRQNGD